MYRQNRRTFNRGNNNNNRNGQSSQAIPKRRTNVVRKRIIRANPNRRRFVRRQYFRPRRFGFTTNNNNTASNRFRQMRVNAPTGLGYNVENMQNSTIIIRRTGYLHAVQASLQFKINAFNMHPTLLPWVRTMSKLYDKYKFINVAVRYMGQCPSNYAGTVFIAYDYDPHTDLPDNSWKAQAYDKFTSCPVWSTSSWISVTRNILNDKWYDCDIDPKNVNTDSWHDKFPGRIIYGTEGGAASNGVTVGQIEITYTIKLSRPTYNGSETSPSPDVSFTSNLDNTGGGIEGGIESISNFDSLSFDGRMCV